MESGEELRRALQRHPTGVAVVTVDLDGERLGLTVGTLISLSLEPPLVGVAISRQAALHELLRGAGGFAVSILRADQVSLAQHFARGVPPIALWQGIAHRDGTRGPLLEDALAWLECGLHAEHAAGDHTLFVGAVERVALGAPGQPLVRVEGDYT